MPTYEIVQIESFRFPDLFLALDATGVSPGKPGGKALLLPFKDPRTLLILEHVNPTDPSLVVIRSTSFNLVYLRMDGTGVTSWSFAGGGSVDCHTGLDDNCRLRIVRNEPRTVGVGQAGVGQPEICVFQSTRPDEARVVLRLDGQPGAKAQVNCQAAHSPFTGPGPDDFEKCKIHRQSDNNPVMFQQQE